MPIFQVNASVEPALDTLINQLMNQHSVPGLSFAKMESHQIVHSKSYGYANTASQDPVRTDTLFEAASLSKPVFTYIVMQLVEEKHIDLDKPLYQYFDQPLYDIRGYEDFASDERYKLLTARMVLAHTTGLPNWRNNLKGRKLVFIANPGERYTYSGEGFELLQAVVEHITQKSLSTLAQIRVFKPLAMHNSQYELKEDTKTHYAVGHSLLMKPQNKRFVHSGSSAYSLHTTASDYATFMLAMAKSASQIDHPMHAVLLKQSQFTKSLEGAEQTISRGLGVGITVVQESTYFWHSGSNPYYKAFAILDTHKGNGMVVLTNSDFGEHIVLDILDTAMGGLGLPRLYKRVAFAQTRLNAYQSFFLNISRNNVEYALSKYTADNRLSNPEKGILLEVGHDLSAQNQNEKALSLFNKALAFSKDDPELLFGLAKANLRLGRIKAVQKNIDNLLNTLPHHKQAKALKKAILAMSYSGNTIFNLSGHKDKHLVTLAGSFNDWNPLSTPMNKTEMGWQIKIDLPPGKHHYKFVIDGQWILDPLNEHQEKTDGYINSVLIKSH